MTNYEIKVSPKIGEPFVMTYANAEKFSIAVSAYRMSGIKIEFDRSLVVPVNTRLSVRSHYAGD